MSCACLCNVFVLVTGLKQVAALLLAMSPAALMVRRGPVPLITTGGTTNPPVRTSSENSICLCTKLMVRMVIFHHWCSSLIEEFLQK